MTEILDGMFDPAGQWTHGLLDSIVVKIDLDGAESAGNRNEYLETKLAPIYALQNKLQVECIKEAVKTDYDPLTSKKACTAQNNVISFKVHERFAQDMYYLGALGNYVEPPANLNRTTLSFAGASTVTYGDSVRVPPAAGQMPDTDFDTIWKATFTLDPRVNVEKEIWLIQDKKDFSEKHPVPKEEPAANSTNSTNGTADATDAAEGGDRRRLEQGNGLRDLQSTASKDGQKN